jgi:hypothetical protein
MVLVGLVAALGVTIPTPTQCNQWWLSVRNVGSAALADWDHWKPHGKNELQGVLYLSPMVAREQPTGGQVRHEETRPAASPDRIGESQASAGRVIAAHHMKLPKPNEVTSRDKSETWPDLPANVFQTRPLVFEPLVISGDLNGGVAYDLNRIAEGIGIKPPTASGTRIATGPGKPPGALARVAGKIKKEPASPRNEVAPEPVNVPISRIDNLEAGLWAGLIQSAEHVVAEDRKAPSSTPPLARLFSKLEHGLPRSPHVALDEWLDFDGADLIGAESTQAVPSDLVIADEEGGSIPILGSDRGFDPVESPDLVPWPDALAFDRRDFEPVVGPAHPLKTTDVVSQPEISSDLKQALLLTKDAFNAWMNLVRRGSSFKITKR